MRFSRETSNRINDLLDAWVPPAVRDSRPFAAVSRRLYDTLVIDINDLKDVAFEISDAEYAAFYRDLQSRFDQGETDLTPESADAVVDAVVGSRVLDVACGKGYLARRLADGHQVVGCDIALHTGDRALAHRGFVPCEATIERLPFRDSAFDTVVTTHTLEHVRDLHGALQELRRVARQRLVVVVPRQRPYRVTFNPHIQFFPYRWSLLAWTGTTNPHSCELVGDDWLYIEELEANHRSVL
jgi:ubiquinone/menaquinone biosynthesis C-methylase UbiE